MASDVKSEDSENDFHGIRIGDCVQIMDQLGKDYRTILVLAKDGSHEALVELMEYSHSGVFDGAASLTHSDVLLFLLEHLKDEPFNRALTSLTNDAANHIKRKLLVTAEDRFKKKFPKTFNMEIKTPEK